MAAEKFGEALKPLFEKITDFFNILDLSFFLSGVAFFSFSFLFLQLGTPDFLAGLLDRTGFIWIIVICYIMGLLCFATGKFLRRKFMKWFRADFLSGQITDAVDFQQCTELPLFQEYADYFDLQRNRKKRKYFKIFKDFKDKYRQYKTWQKKKRHYLYHLYIKGWVVLRNDPHKKPCYLILNQFWVKTAIFDGLAFTLLFFFGLALALLCSRQLPWNPRWVIFLVVTPLFGLLCWNEAIQYDKTQIRELVAALCSPKAVPEEERGYSEQGG